MLGCKKNLEYCKKPAVLPQGQENQEKSGQTKKNVKGQENSVKNGSFWKKSGNLTTFEKMSDFVCLNLENSYFQTLQMIKN